ncbi:Predicted pyrophosphatase or phosphodiesterase, AlkP superfamily [Zobellia uliginosa]|uniref:Predicted pyrophosphatase or phosphodiesterase, AlkP superfamily n=1 Tax=Zobellia uliginosa TaxID=143224 RepID=A0ABY1L254_9FLAO|nr:alkaline phosphatase PafA [Zobellia uliginosa]SIT15297.1 Predicted pyrophosphatase or phosphodiesterase, AlkP superfamily [Zobellia uliginosa]
MHKNYFIVFLSVFTLTFLPSDSLARRKSKEQPVSGLRTEPKLVVGIIVDQMRYDYITRFWNHYGEGGFKRLVNEGFNCRNNHYNYAPTSTGPGHTSVYTGTTPAMHGIIGNNWYDKATETSVYCAGDPDYESVGTTSDAGKMSPHRMTVTTITDELRLHTQMRGKTIAVALKDRGAVLPGGHTANAAYWFSDGAWITSSYYMDKLPLWVEKFNAEKSVDAYKKPWKTLKNINEYVESAADYNTYEGKFKGEESPVFPHDVPALWDNNGKYEMLKATPFGNSMTTDFALAALDAEALGADEITDFLALSFSSTDYVGHKFGVASKEVQDTYLRLDRDLERLFKELDRKVGKGEYTVFLSADHAAIEVPSYLKDQKIPADYVSWDAMKNDFAQFLEFNYGTTDIVKNFSNYQYFLDHDIINNLDLSVQEVQEAIAKEVLGYEGIDRTYTAYQMWQNDYTHGIPYILQNGYNQKRSGDVLVVLAPGTISYQKTGSTHGSPQIYDTHVPLLFYGAGIKQGSTVERTEIDDIAPTIAALLGVSFPSGTTGSPITQVLQ